VENRMSEIRIVKYSIRYAHSSIRYAQVETCVGLQSVDAY